MRRKLAEVATELLPHQQRVVSRMLDPNQPGLVVAHGLGSGKTLTSIATQDALGMPASVVLPAALQENYAKERAKHLTGDTQPADMTTLQAIARRGEPPSGRLLIVDEAHRIRDASSKGSQALRRSAAEKRMLLTATPFYNAASDVAPLINVAAGKNVLPNDPNEFYGRYVTDQVVMPSWVGRNFRHETPGLVEKVNPKTAPALRATFAKYMDYHPSSQEGFPSVERKDVKVEMSPEQLKVYDAMLGEAPPWVAAKIRAGLPPSKREAQELNAFMGAVRQVSNTTGAYAPDADVHQPKIEQAFQNLQKYLGENERAKAVVYSNYLESGLHPYAQKLQEAGIPHGMFTGEMKQHERDQMVRDYNEGKLKALLLSSAGGEGLDLKGTRLMQVLDPHWNEEKLRQVEGRGVRYGSHADLPEEERRVLIERYLATRPRAGVLEKLRLKKPGGSVDEYLTNLSGEKERLHEQFRQLMPGYEKRAELAEDGEHKLQGHPDFKGMPAPIKDQKCLSNALRLADNNQALTIMMGPSDRKQDPRHFWAVDRKGVIHDPTYKDYSKYDEGKPFNLTANAAFLDELRKKMYLSGQSKLAAQARYDDLSSVAVSPEWAKTKVLSALRKGVTLNVHEKTAASVDELVSGSGRLKNVEVVPMPTSPTSAAGGRSLPNGTIIVPPEGSYESLQKKLQVLGRPQLPALSRDGERAFNAQVLLHEQMERNRRHVGESWQRHRPGVLLDEHNMLARMTGPGSEEVRSLVTQLRNTPRPNTPMADIPAVTQLMERLGVKGFQYGHGQRIPKAMKKQLITMMKSAEKAEDGEHDLQGHIDFRGLHIAVENRKGSVRSGTTPDGHKWRTVMKAPYGYFESKAKGKDGESIDVYVGPDKKSPTAFVVHQHKPDGTGFDEDKVMLGFRSLEEAKAMYLKHYDDPKFLGPISTVPVEELKKKLQTDDRIEKISAAYLMMKRAMEFFDSPDKAREVLQPGDVLVTRAKGTGPTGRLFAKTLESAQSSKFYHSAMYVGDGKVVHTRLGEGITEVPLDKFHDMYQYRALRVNAPEEDRDQAARFAKDMLQKGKPYDAAGLLRTFWKGEPGATEDRKKELDKYICSSLIAAAYPDKVFQGRGVQNTRPVDIAKSKHTSLIGQTIPLRTPLHKVAEDQSVSVGYASATVQPRGEDGVTVEKLWVDPEHRGKGEARKLMERIKDQFADKDIWLKPRPFGDMEAPLEVLKEFYKTMGFEVMDKQDNMRLPRRKEQSRG